jgi:hypothetical protein
MKDKVCLYRIYCKVKTGSKEKSKSYNQIKMCTCMDMVDDEWWMKWKLLLYDLSPSVDSFENMVIFLFFFFLDLHVSKSFFLSIFLLGPSRAYIFFFDSPCLFYK